ncbi:MAG: AAA family ATPase, partial [Candidatus Thermoplasmatota archaeon]|nr:AAA family ATPase [Candidatus Thermoplasmatota archaeon]
QKNIMTKLLQQEKISKKVIENICSILVSFYKSDKSTEEIKEYGNKNSVKQNIDENFEQTKNVIDVTIPKDMYQFIQHASEKFFDMKSDLFNRRIQDGFIHDCHGDLHSGNIVVDGSSICIFDCIEFNKRFRFADVASDIGFLAMDLDYMNHPYLSSYLISNYIEKSKDVGIFDMLNFYKSYRAYVRGKVIGFRLNDPNIPKDEKQDIINTTKKYFDLSQYYASLFSLDLENKKPLLFVVGGLTGTGKSTLSLKISVDYHAHNINTDVVRKELAGIDKFERHHDEIDTGLYSPERIDHTYEQVMKKSADFLKNGENVVLDATFQRKKYRDMAKKIAKENNAVLVPIKCTCPEEIVKKWLEERLKTKTASDGRWEIYLNQKKTFESFTAEENCVVMDVSEESYKDRMDSFRRLLSKVHDGEK